MPGNQANLSPMSREFGKRISNVFVVFFCGSVGTLIPSVFSEPEWVHL